MRIPAGTPPGSGGGYFIVKNSWSNCYGDGGYVYLPWDYVSAHASSLYNVVPN
jgi:C1A family cysteine protease